MNSSEKYLVLVLILLSLNLVHCRSQDSTDSNSTPSITAGTVAKEEESSVNPKKNIDLNTPVSSATMSSTIPPVMANYCDNFSPTNATDRKITIINNSADKDANYNYQLWADEGGCSHFSPYQLPGWAALPVLDTERLQDCQIIALDKVRKELVLAGMNINVGDQCLRFKACRLDLKTKINTCSSSYVTTIAASYANSNPGPYELPTIFAPKQTIEINIPAQ